MLSRKRNKIIALSIIGIVIVSYCLFLSIYKVSDSSKLPDSSKEIDSILLRLDELNSDIKNIHNQLNNIDRLKIKSRYLYENEVNHIMDSPYDSAVKHISDYLSENGKNKG